MAIGAACVWEVRTTGNDTNGGGYAGGGTDWSQQDSPQYAVTDGVANGTTTITSATANFGTDVVGNVMYVQGGTGAVTAGWYQIISRTNATTIVVDRSTGLTAGTDVTLRIGGAFATPGRVPAVAVSGNYVWIKSGTYTLTTSTAGPAGPVNFSTNIKVYVEGYQATRGDRTGTRPIIHAGAITAITLFAMSCTNNHSHPRNIEVNGNSGASNIGFSYAGLQLGPVDCCAKNCTTGFSITGHALRCIADNCSTIGFTITSGSATRCIARNCAARGFYTQMTSHCVAISCGQGFSEAGATTGTRHINAIASGCTTGFWSDGLVRPNHMQSCIARNCTIGYLVWGEFTLEDCAGFGNTTNVSGTPRLNQNFMSLAADPVVSGTDFTLTSAAAAVLLANQWLDETWKQYAGAVPPVAGGGGSAGVFLPRPMNGGYSA